MPGGSEAYRCDVCPLILELGESAVWDEKQVVISEWNQVACGACGTLHRLHQERGECRVTALPGPIRSARTVTAREITGEEIKTMEWVTAADWQPVGPHAGGLNAVDTLACSHCGSVGRMLTYERFKYPEGHARGPRTVCPVCSHPMECFSVSDWI